MATRGQFNTKNPTIKRILKEAAELANNASSDYHAEPLEDNLFEWHFTLRGPPEPSPYANGLYHGRIVLPAAYPLRPPSFRFVTPTGRFEVNREICLSISGHHEETWQPAWGIRTALVAIRSFMDTDAKGQLGGIDAPKENRRTLASQSGRWTCAACGKSNSKIMAEREELAKEMEGEGKSEEAVPEELRLAYREDLGAKEGGQSQSGEGTESAAAPPEDAKPGQASQASSSLPSAPGPAPRPRVSVNSATGVRAAPVPTRTIPAATVQQQRTNEDGIPAWIDKAIFGIIGALIFFILRKFL